MLGSTSLNPLYVVSRGTGGRPLLMHIVDGYPSDATICGYVVKATSRNFSRSPLTSILCKKCSRIYGVTNNAPR